MPDAVDAETLFAQARAGTRAALARLVSLVERGGADAHAVARVVHGRTGGAWSVGITGAPGAGKSTLTDRLVGVIRDGGAEVGVLAVDPSSPFTGGAILGDRIRMQEHSTDPGVFIRSMATRGHLGGLAVATPQAARVLGAAGFPWILIETVGVGQVEVEIAGHADTTVVVVNPGWGDEVQAAKAGLLEIADVFVVNKADRPGAEDAVRDLEAMLHMASDAGWRPPVVCTSAMSGAGVTELWEAISRHRASVESSGDARARRRERLRREVRTIVAERLLEAADAQCRGPAFDALLDDIVAGRRNPYAAADALLGAPGGDDAER